MVWVVWKYLLNPFWMMILAPSNLIPTDTIALQGGGGGGEKEIIRIPLDTLHLKFHNKPDALHELITLFIIITVV